MCVGLEFAVYNLCYACLNCKRIYLIQKRGFNKIINGYWYTKYYGKHNVL